MNTFRWVSDQEVLIAAVGHNGDVCFLHRLDSKRTTEIKALAGVALDALIIPTGDPKKVVLLRHSFLSRNVVIDRWSGRESREPGGLSRAPWLDTSPQSDVYISHGIPALGYSRDFHIATVDLESGQQQMRERTGDFEKVVVSENGDLFAAWTRRNDDWRVRTRANPRARWNESGTQGPIAPWLPVAVATGGKGLIGFNFAPDRAAQVSVLNLATGQTELLASRELRDPKTLIFSPHTRTPIGVQFHVPHGTDIEWFDRDAKALQDTLDRALPARVNEVTDASADGAFLVVKSAALGGVPQHYLLERERGRLSTLGNERPDLPAAACGKIEQFEFVSRDGLRITGNLLVPAVSASPPPLVVLSPGRVGEAARSGAEYDALRQFFANRGIATVDFGVRGTAGYGIPFLRAGDFQLSGAILNDVEDGLKHLAAARRIDGSRVGIYGAGFSGLVALRVAANSNAFKAAATFNSWGELQTGHIALLASVARPLNTMIESAGGTQRAMQLLRELEPASFAPKMTAKVLLIYLGKGQSESGVSTDDARRLRDAFARHNKSYRWQILDERSVRTPLPELEAELATSLATFFSEALKEE